MKMKGAILAGIVVLAIIIASQNAIAQTNTNKQAFAQIGAGLSIGLAALGAGIAVGMAAAAGVGVLTERRDMFGTVLIFVAIGEGIAVYGILFAVLMLFGKF